MLGRIGKDSAFRVTKPLSMGHTCLAETVKSIREKCFPKQVAVCCSSIREQCLLGSGSGPHSAWRSGDGSAQHKRWGTVAEKCRQELAVKTI